MKLLSQTTTSLAFLALSPLLANSCRERDPLVDEMVRQQATHHEIVARQSEELTKASQKLVEAEAQSRREQVESQAQLQAQIQSQRQDLDAQRNALESERREIAQQRFRDPLIASALIQVATLLIAALPLALLVYLTRLSRSEPAHEPLSELLVHDITADTPLMFPAPLVPSQHLLSSSTPLSPGNEPADDSGTDVPAEHS